MVVEKPEPNTKLNAVFEGGGVRGIAHIGALSRMEEQGWSFSNVAGTSAGAIVAGLYAAGYPSNEMKDILMKQDFSKLLSNPFSPLLNVVRKLGVHDADNLYKWLVQLFRDKNVSVFSDLRRSLTIRVANVTDQCLWDISDKTHPAMDVAEAITMSATIPFFFQPRQSGNKLLVDGGVISNYPLSIFSDSPIPTIGFKLINVSDTEIRSKPSNLVSFAHALVSTMRRAHDKHHAENRFAGMTIHIDCGTITSTNFSLSDEQKKSLYSAGMEAATAFLDSSGERLKAGTPPGHLSEVELKLSHALVESLKDLSKEEDYPSILRIGSAISRILYLEGMLQARLEIGKIVENAAMMADDPGKRVKALIDDIGWSLVTMQKRDEGEIQIRDGITLATNSGEFYWAAKGYRHLAGIALSRRILDDARRHLEKSLLEAQKIEHQRDKKEMLAGIYYGLAEVEIRSGNYDIAEKKIDETECLYRELGDYERLLKIYAQRAKVALARSQYSIARDFYREGIRECKKLNRTDELIRNYDGLSKLAKEEGDVETANEMQRKADALKLQLPLPF